VCNTIKNRVGFTSIGLKFSKASNKSAFVPENNKVDSLLI